MVQYAVRVLIFCLFQSLAFAQAQTSAPALNRAATGASNVSNVSNGAYANQQAKTPAGNYPGSNQNSGQGNGQVPPQPMPAPLPSGQPDRNLVQDALDQSVPLSPSEIRNFLSELTKRNQAILEGSGAPQTKPVTSMETLDLSPGSTPPIVRVAMGQGAVVSFSDAAGRPWPIADNLNFNASAYEVKLIGPHLYTIKLNRPAPANITVVLKDLPRPIVITALPATSEVDYLKEFTVPKFIDGVAPPSVATSVLTQGALALNAPELLNFLYRTPPRESKQLGVLGLQGVMAWQNSPSTMVIRTSGLVVIPGWLRRHSSVDGVSVYEVPLSSVATIAQDGMQHRININGIVVPISNQTSAKSSASSGGAVAPSATTPVSSSQPLSPFSPSSTVASKTAIPPAKTN